MVKRKLNDEFFTLWILIAQTKDALLKARQKQYDSYSIGNERRAVLWGIKSYGGEASPVEISRLLLRELNSVSEMLKRMEKEKLIKKYATSGKYRVKVKLTKIGEEVFNQSLYNEVDQRILAILSKKQREQLISYLWKIRKEALRELGIPEWHIVFPPEPVIPDSNRKVIKASRLKAKPAAKAKR
jgi:DNA-binding MarR family transcriptional regulator